MIVCALFSIKMTNSGARREATLSDGMSGSVRSSMLDPPCWTQ